MEVILADRSLYLRQRRILHVCGGDPNLYEAYMQSKKYSPRVWRWSQSYWNRTTKRTVFSTCVEVILIHEKFLIQRGSILHVCGGDPLFRRSMVGATWYSPRVWRWSSLSGLNPNMKRVFSTCVEVIPIKNTPSLRLFCILHVCGGDPVICSSNKSTIRYSPRVWRWSSSIP